MIKTSELWKTIVENPNFLVEWEVDVGGVTYAQSDLYGISMQFPVFSKLSVGNVCSAQLSLDLMPKETPPRMAEIVVKMKVFNEKQKSEFVNRGVFYIDEREAGPYGRLSITAFDNALLSEKGFFADDIEYEWPASPTQVMGTVMSRIGAELDPRTVLSDDKIVEITDMDISCRAMASHVAAALAGNWVVTNEGKWLLVKLKGGELVRVGKNVISLDKGEEQKPISMVSIIAGEDESGNTLVYVSGDDSGSNLDVSLPWGNQPIADYILSQVSGFEYHPYSVSGAIADPALDVCDEIFIDTWYGIVGNITMKSSGIVDISCPIESVIEKEIPYQSGEIEELKRKIKTVSSSFSVNTKEILAQVSGIKYDLDTATDDLQGQLTDQAGKLEELEQKTSLTVTQDQVEIIVSEAVAGVNSVTTSTGFKFDDIGMTISSTESEFSALARPFGFYIKRGEENVMVADSEGVEAINLTVNKYLNIGGIARLEPYGADRIGCFWIGG